MGLAFVPNSFTLPLLAGLSIAGAALGAQFGKSAISEINPAYFREPETSFHADLVAYRSPDWAQVQAKEYASGDVPIGECIGCSAGPTPAYPVAYAPAHDPYIDVAAGAFPPAPRKARARVAVATPVEAESAYVEEARDPARERIVRYSSYPVTQEEAQARQAPAAEDIAATQ